MSSCDQASDLYYEGETGVPKVHWALVIEINHLLKHPSGTKFGTCFSLVLLLVLSLIST